MVDIFIDCKAGPLLTSSLATDAFRKPWSSRSLRTCAQLVGCGAFEAEELQVGGNQLEQHVGADLDRAAFVLGCLQQRGDVGLEHHISDVRTGSDAVDVRQAEDRRPPSRWGWRSRSGRSPRDP